MIKPTAYNDINHILNELLSGAQVILGENFVGMYLDGSLASGDFDYETSDIDFVVATAVSVTPQQFDQLVTMHKHIGQLDNKWRTDLEAAYIPLEALRRYNPEYAPCPYLDQGTSTLRWEQLGIDWAIHYYVLNKYGKTIVGPSMQTLVKPVSKAKLQQAVCDLLDGWWIPMIHDDSKLSRDDYRRYAIMTMCRMLYTAQIGDVTSKPKAANWVLETQDAQWQSLASAALKWHGDELNVSVAETQAFIQFTRDSIGDKDLRGFENLEDLDQGNIMSIKETTITYRNFRGESDYQNMVDIINGSKDADGLE